MTREVRIRSKGAFGAPHRAGQVVLVALLAAGAALVMGPFVWMILSSFKTSQEIVQVPITWWPKRFSLSAYRDMWAAIPLLRGYMNSMIVSGATTAAVLVTSSLTGYVLGKKRFFLRDAIFVFILSTIMVPFVVLVVPLFVEMVRMGLKDTYLGLIVPGIYSSFGIFLMRQFMHGIPDELVDAGVVDGAGDLRIYAQIIVPLTRPALSALAIFTFMDAFNAFLWPLIMIDNRDLETLPLVLAKMTSSNVIHYNWQMAAAVLSIVPVVVVYMVFQRNFVQGIALTGIKA